MLLVITDTKVECECKQHELDDSDESEQDESFDGKKRR